MDSVKILLLKQVENKGRNRWTVSRNYGVIVKQVQTRVESDGQYQETTTKTGSNKGRIRWTVTKTTTKTGSNKGRIRWTVRN